MKRVNLLIIGTQKAGTTSLFNYLKQHQEIYFSEVKEVTFFVDDKFYSKGVDYYHSFFPRHKHEKIIASSYVHMLPCDYCPERVFKYNPEMKFLVVLRNPVDRAYSAYHYAMNNGWEDENNSFMKCFELESGRLKGSMKERFDLAYFHNGLYHKHLTNWLRYFPKENFLIIRDADLRNAAQETMDQVFRFLGLENTGGMDFSKRYNQSGKARFKMVQKVMLDKDSRLKIALGKVLPQRVKLFVRSYLFPVIYELNLAKRKALPMDDETRAFLTAYYASDLELLSRDFFVNL